MVIKVNVDGIYLIAIQPFSTQVERENLVLFLLKQNIQRVGFIDLAPTRDILDLIKMLDAQGIATKLFIDHHENDEKIDEVINARAIYEYIENENFRFYPRSVAPSAASLVKTNEAATLGLDAVFFHYDIDGFSGAIKATFLGSKYPWFDSVANIAEKGLISNIPLTTDAKRYMHLMQAGMNVGPPYQYDSQKRNIALQELYFNIALWLAHDQDDTVIADFINELQEVNEMTSEISYQIIQNTLRRDDGIIFVDCFEIMNKGKRPNFQVLKKELFRLAEGFMLVAIRVLGHKGDQISIFKPRDFDLDLPKLLPADEAGDWHIDARIHIRANNFSAFKYNYLQAVTALTH